jgi:CheY-like chemotaxis protein
MSDLPASPNVTAEQLALLSHEFRTPLNGVLGMARLLEGTRLTPEQKDYVSALRTSGEHLLSLVNEVLSFAKLGSNEVELHAAPVDVEDLLRSVCELMSPRAAEKRLEVAWAAPSDLGRIHADEGRLRQILLNFAGNAIKFTERGGVLLSVARVGDSSLRFTVADTGPGVSEAAAEKIFEAFEQANPAVDDAKLGGAGLGLAIARKLALAFGGEVGVGPAPGGGASFWFEARFAGYPGIADDSLRGRRVAVVSSNPIIRDAARRQIEACGGSAVISAALGDVAADVLLIDHAMAPEGRRLGAPKGQPALILLAPEERDHIEAYRRAGFAGYLIKPLRRASLAERVQAVLGSGTRQQATLEIEDDRVAPAAAPGAKVLLVEDNPINALLARTLLAREGCVVDHAGGGEQAIAALQVGRYDLILMDMRMPGLSGLDATRRLRASGITTPVVALTANAFEEDRHACLEAGMDDFLVKPLSPDALRAILTTLARGGWTQSPDRAKLG